MRRQTRALDPSFEAASRRLRTRGAGGRSSAGCAVDLVEASSCRSFAATRSTARCVAGRGGRDRSRKSGASRRIGKLCNTFPVAVIVIKPLTVSNELQVGGPPSNRSANRSCVARSRKFISFGSSRRTNPSPGQAIDFDGEFVACDFISTIRHVVQRSVRLSRPPNSSPTRGGPAILQLLRRPYLPQ